MRQPLLSPQQVIDAVSSFGGKLDTVVYRSLRRSGSSLASICRRHGSNAVLPLTISPRGLSLPWVGYIPDLQHRRHPEFFQPRECAIRDRQFTRLLRDAKAVIVNSRDTQNDIDRFFPGHACAIFPLPFAPVLNPAWLQIPAAPILARYQLPQRYFLVANQFWAHKSHLTAFEALQQLGTEYSDVGLVCTGSTWDYRHPEYFHGLRRRIAELDLHPRIRILGRVPKNDQIQILRGALALIQPTLFEGGPGGGAVYDAVATGTPAIVSDIPVNREMKPVPAGDGTASEDELGLQFFQVRSAEDLAGKMRAAIARPAPRPSPAELCRRSAWRAERLGSRLLEAIDCARQAGASAT